MSAPALLRRHRLWLLPGLVLALLLAAMSLRDSKEFASASTVVLVDWATAPYLLDIKQSLDPLGERAGVLARLAPSPGIVDRIARRAGVDPDQITAAGPYKPGAPRTEQEPSAERRGVQLAAERDPYRLRFDSEEDRGVPIVSIIAQAPTVERAERIADSSAAALTDYVSALQSERHVPPRQRIALRGVGRADGSVVNPGVDKQVAALQFVGVLLAWTMLLVAVLRFGPALLARASAPRVSLPGPHA
jgi:hypothetical protein